MVRTWDFHSRNTGSSPVTGIRREVAARGAIKVCVAQRLEHSAVNRKVAGSIPVANGLEQLLELREPTVSLENLVFNCASGARTLPSRKEGFKGNLGSPSLG